MQFVNLIIHFLLLLILLLFLLRHVHTKLECYESYQNQAKFILRSIAQYSCKFIKFLTCYFTNFCQIRLKRAPLFSIILLYLHYLLDYSRHLLVIHYPKLIIYCIFYFFYQIIVCKSLKNY